jgi:hypothetical protein
MKTTPCSFDLRQAHRSAEFTFRCAAAGNLAAAALAHRMASHRRKMLIVFAEHR